VGLARSVSVMAFLIAAGAVTGNVACPISFRLRES
jgi:hypothetical protein